ncbi:MAG: hypothetical protein J2P15_12895 [Micromonosporaceae bacterium]|nr:hypothetical protein [Micromonosporaceae bacterium]
MVAAALNLPVGDLAETADLFELGMDSLALIRLITQWRRSGRSVTFEELTENPTLAAWQALLAGPAPDAVAD